MTEFPDDEKVSIFSFRDTWEDHLARYHAGYNEEDYGTIEYRSHFYGGNIYKCCARCGDVWIYPAL